MRELIAIRLVAILGVYWISFHRSITYWLESEVDPTLKLPYLLVHVVWGVIFSLYMIYLVSVERSLSEQSKPPEIVHVILEVVLLVGFLFNTLIVEY